MILNPTDVTLIDTDDDAPIVSAPFVIDEGGNDGAHGQHNDVPEPSDIPLAADRELEQQVPTRAPAPVPVIGSVPLAGVVIDAGQLVCGAGSTRNAIIGVSPHARPFVLGIMLRHVSGAGTATIVPDTNPDSAGIGYPIPGPSFAADMYPAKRLAVQLVGDVVIGYAVIASDVPQNV